MDVHKYVYICVCIYIMVCLRSLSTGCHADQRLAHCARLLLLLRPLKTRREVNNIYICRFVDIYLYVYIGHLQSVSPCVFASAFALSKCER